MSQALQLMHKPAEWGRASATGYDAGRIARFAQHTQLRARAGKRDELLAKFLEVADMQRDNPACEVTIVSSSPQDDDVVFLTEVWRSAEDHARARQSAEVQAWAESDERRAGAVQYAPRSGLCAE